VVILTAHEEKDFSKYSNVLGTVKDYNDPLIKKLL
jgi:hypothetical protein